MTEQFSQRIVTNFDLIFPYIYNIVNSNLNLLNDVSYYLLLLIPKYLQILFRIYSFKQIDLNKMQTNPITEAY